MNGNGNDNGKPLKGAARWNDRIRKPGAILLLALIASATLNALLFGFTLYPAVKKQVALKLKHFEAELKLAALEKTPVPERVDPAELEKLLRRMPTKPEIARFLFALREIGRRSGAEIVQLTTGESEIKKEDALSYLFSQDGLNAIAKRPDAPVAPGAEADKKDSDNAVYEEIRYELAVRGSYRQIVDFVRGVHRMERLVSIPVWRIVQGTPEGVREEQPLVMTMVLVLYAGIGYDGKFPELPQPEVPSVQAGRLDPTMSDWKFQETLRKRLSDDG